jgi:hypothetical protein
MRTDPVGQALCPGCLGVGVVGCTEHRDEYLRGAHLASALVDDLDRLAGIVDEHLLTGTVGLTHHPIKLANPAAVVVAEPAVGEALRVGGEVLLPQQRQGHTGLAQLLVGHWPVRHRSALAGLLQRRRERIQTPLQFGITQPLGQGPTHYAASGGELNPKGLNNALAPIGARIFGPVTCGLRRERMYEFLDRLINIAIPRVRDFRGVNGKSFDGRGNYSMGVKEQIIFPEVEYDKVDAIRGMDITITTSAKTDEEGRALLAGFNFPFK